MGAVGGSPVCEARNWRLWGAGCQARAWKRSREAAAASNSIEQRRLGCGAAAVEVERRRCLLHQHGGAGSSFESILTVQAIYSSGASP